jgi:hypothetical protein
VWKGFFFHIPNCHVRPEKRNVPGLAAEERRAYAGCGKSDICSRNSRWIAATVLVSALRLAGMPAGQAMMQNLKVQTSGTA